MNSLELWPVVQGGMYCDWAVQGGASQEFGRVKPSLSCLTIKETLHTRQDSACKWSDKRGKETREGGKGGGSWLEMKCELDLYVLVYTSMYWVCTLYILVYTVFKKNCRGCCFRLYDCGKLYCVCVTCMQWCSNTKSVPLSVSNIHDIIQLHTQYILVCTCLY
jgi:hypothetical protein